jgi:hypothetical protein
MEKSVDKPRMVRHLYSVFEWAVEPHIQRLSDPSTAPRNEVDKDVEVIFLEPVLELR